MSCFVFRETVLISDGLTSQVQRSIQGALMFEYNVAMKMLVGRFISIIAGYPHGVDDTRDPTQDRQTDVDEEISTASSLKEDSKRRKNEGEDELANITRSKNRSVTEVCDSTNSAGLKKLKEKPKRHHNGDLRSGAEKTRAGSATYEAVKGILS